MTAGVKDTNDIKYAWLASLENMAMSLSRLRKECPTICPSQTAKSLRLDTDLIFTAEKLLEESASRLMGTWGISQRELLTWMDLGPADLAKRMNWKGSSVSHLVNSHIGRTRRSRKK